jgi:putative ABC transport system permease protein
MALGALSSNKLRSALTVLGIIIGVAAVIALMSIGAGVQKTISDQLSSVGSNLIFVYPGSQRQTNVPCERCRRIWQLQVRLAVAY